MIEIFNLFKRKNHIENQAKTIHKTQENDQTSSVLEEGSNALKEIEKFLCTINNQKIFTNLLFFIAYYSFIIEFYRENMDRIISVKELLLLKYIPMMKEILSGFDEENANWEQKEQLADTIRQMNEKLYATIKNIKEVQQLNFHVDLKTLQDLFQSDF